MRQGAILCLLVLLLASLANSKLLPAGAFPATKLGRAHSAVLSSKFRFKDAGGTLSPDVISEPGAPAPTDLEPAEPNPVTHLLPDGASIARASFHPATPVRPDQAKVMLNETSDSDLLTQLQTHTRECPMQMCKVNDDCRFANGTCCSGGTHCCPHNAACINTDPPYCIHYTSRDPEKCAEEECIAHHSCPIEGVSTCCIGGEHCCPMDSVCANTNPPSCRKLVDPKEIAEQSARMKKYTEQTEKAALERHRHQASEAEKAYAAGVITEWALKYRRAVVAHDFDVVNAKEAHINYAKNPGNEVLKQTASVLDVQVEKSKEKMLLAEERMQKYGEYVKKTEVDRSIEKEVKTDANALHFFGHKLTDRANVDDSTNVVYIDEKLTFKTEGTLIGWEFYAKRAGHHKLCLFSDNGSSPSIVHCTEAQTTETGLQKLKVHPPFDILPGYTVGWMHGGRGVIAYSDDESQENADQVKWHPYEFAPSDGETVKFNPGHRDTISGQVDGRAPRSYSVRVAYRKPELTQSDLNEKVEEAKMLEAETDAKEETDAAQPLKGAVALQA